MRILELSQPDVRPIKESGEIYKLFEAYKFGFELNGREYWPKIEKGFQYDGASVPRAVWSLIGFLPDGIHRPAALIHDWLYEKQGHISITEEEFIFTRKEADQLFFHALEFVGVKSWHARIAYLAVRAFGGFYWKG